MQGKYLVILITLHTQVASFILLQTEVEETLKRIQAHKGVTGVIVVNSEGWFFLGYILLSAYKAHYIISH